MWHRMHFEERAREERGGGEGERAGGGEEGVVTRWQKGMPFSGGPGPSRSGKMLHRAESCQHIGHGAYLCGNFQRRRGEGYHKLDVG